MAHANDATPLHVDPDSNPLVRANARFFLAWRSMNETWIENVRSNAKWWLIWEATWPLLIISIILLWCYFILGFIVFYPLDKLW